MKKSISFLVCLSMLAVSATYATMPNNTSSNVIVSSTNNDQISSLCKAAMKGDVDQVRSLLATGEELNEKSLGMTPAMYAARYNQAEVLKVLLLNGANLNIKSEKGYTAKEYAKMSNATEALAVLNTNS